MPPMTAPAPQSIDGLLADEEARVQRLLRTRFDSILVVSDLHLGLGVDTVSTRWARTENFFSDEEFRRALRWTRTERQVKGLAVRQPQLLVLNGDIFDFLRVSRVPLPEEYPAWANLLTSLGRTTTAAELNTSKPARSERQFGLRTNDYKSVWKLTRILDGHLSFCAALAEWVEDGGTILFIKGNHDVELYWPLVHAAIRQRVHGSEENVLFAQDYVQIANVYIEHGHQREGLTAVNGPPRLPGNQEELNLPPGSFVNRYLVNPLERAVPFLDNIKPQTDMIAAFVRKHPILAIRMLGQSGRFLVRSIKAGRVWDSSAILVYLIGMSLPLITGVAVLLAWKYAAINAFFSRVLSGLEIPAAVVGFLGPYIIGALREVYQDLKDRITARRHPVGEDLYGRVLAETLPQRLVRTQEQGEYIAVLGHTHGLDRQVLRLGKGNDTFNVTYLNTGTWAPLWPKDRPDLLGRTLRPLLFLDWENGAYRPSQVEWSDAHNSCTQCIILMT